MISVKNIFPKINSMPSTIHEWLIASSSFSLILLLIRMVLTGSMAYGFLAWNLILAFIPYMITRWLVGQAAVIQNRVKLILVLFAWLLFVPNSFYIITDLFHLDHFESAPEWFDLVLILSFAWNGVLCGIISLRRVEMILISVKGRDLSIFMVYMVMWLNAFGIYLGRFLRFNSWDIVTDPSSLITGIIDMMVHPFQNLAGWGMTFCYSVFMTFLYYTIKKMSESFYINQH